MSATTKDLRSLRVGDVIEGHRTMRVDFVNLAAERVGLVDALSGEEFVVDQQYTNDDSWSFNVVKKAAKQYRVGDVVRKNEFNDLPQGTVVKYDDCGADYMKAWGGRWLCSGDGIAYTLWAFGGDVPYTIRYLP